MPRFLVAYDLRKPDRNYQPLYDELKYLGAKRVQESVWVLRSEKETSESLRDKLFAHVDDEDDRILVVSISGFASTNGLTRITDV